MKRLELLDYGRFISIVCVLFFHYFFNGVVNGKISSVGFFPAVADYAKYGYLGVSFFFLISGYVIFFSASNRTARQFAVSRVVRLFPAFWIGVLFTSIFAHFWGGSLMEVSFWQFFANLTMVPGLFGYGFVDGVYWTLQLELAFYSLVLLLLIMGLQSFLNSIFLAWPFAMVCAALLDVDSYPFLGGYYSFFAAGSILAIQKTRRTVISVFSLIVSICLCVRFSVSTADDLNTAKAAGYSLLVVGMIVLLQFVFFVFLNTRIGSGLRLPASKLVGGLTYPIYLVHAYFGYMVLTRFATEENKLFVYLITIAVVFFIAYLINRFFETRLSSFWYWLFNSTVGRAVALISIREKDPAAQAPL